MELSLMTFNIRYDVAHDGENRWANRRDLVLDTVRRHSPDVVGFQEVLPHQRWDLEQGLTGYRFLGRGRERDAAGEQCAIAFRPDIELLGCETFWLSPTPDQPGSVGWDAMLTRICTRASFRWGSQRFSVWNAHFDHHGKAAPGKSAAMLLQRMESFDHPCLLMGDFNSTPDSEAVRILGTRLRDSFADQHPGSSSGTYHEYGTLEEKTRIDYLMVTPDWRILGCEIVDQAQGPYPSDHFPVLGRFVLDSR